MSTVDDVIFGLIFSVTITLVVIFIISLLSLCFRRNTDPKITNSTYDL